MSALCPPPGDLVYFPSPSASPPVLSVSPGRWLLVLVSFAAATGVALWVISSHWPEGGAPLGLPWWGHLLALGAVTFELSLRSAKIALSARACGIPLRFGTAARATLAGDFATSITPARAGAEPARFLVLSEAGVPAARALLVLFLEIFIELLSLVLIAGALLLALPATGALKGVVAMVGGYATVVLGLGVLAWFLSRRRAAGPPPRWALSVGFKPWLWRRLQIGLRHVRDGVDAVRHARIPIMVASLACSVAHISGRLMILPIIIVAVGAQADITSLVLWPLVLLYGGALIPAPAGGGAMEFGFSAIMDDVLPPRLLAASMIWWRFYSYYVYVLLGAFAAGRTVMRALARNGKRAA
ncbi:MAG TPA: lysylphosphatidylglycerol synthase transmembrane domain-containing protein [Gemmatimonadaceae bacterium]